MTQASTPPEARPVELHCMEVWGGITATQEIVSMPGIDAWVWSQPYREDHHGGDIHYVSMCGGGKISRFTIADVSGHGAAVGQVAQSLRALMVKHINTLDQRRLARAVNREFSALSASGVFATALLTTYYAPSDHLVLCNAGHPAPLWFDAVSGEWRVLDPNIPQRANRVSNLPLGVIDGTRYEQFAVKLTPGDMVILYTDALIEATNEAGQMLGIQGLLQLAAGITTREPQQFGRRLLERINAFRGDSAWDDDQTLLVLRHNADNPPWRGVRETAKVLGKMLHLIKV